MKVWRILSGVFRIYTCFWGLWEHQEITLDNRAFHLFYCKVREIRISSETHLALFSQLFLLEMGPETGPEEPRSSFSSGFLLGIQKWIYQPLLQRRVSWVIPAVSFLMTKFWASRCCSRCGLCLIRSDHTLIRSQTCKAFWRGSHCSEMALEMSWESYEEFHSNFPHGL